MKVPTPEEILAQVHAEVHFQKAANSLQEALRAFHRATFHTKYNRAVLPEADLRAFLSAAKELVANVENEQARAFLINNKEEQANG